MPEYYLGFPYIFLCISQPVTSDPTADVSICKKNWRGRSSLRRNTKKYVLSNQPRNYHSSQPSYYAALRAANLYCLQLMLKGSLPFLPEELLRFCLLRAMPSPTSRQQT
jgi:hypothetical protein